MQPVYEGELCLGEASERANANIAWQSSSKHIAMMKK
jgi:hypothetical protein